MRSQGDHALRNSGDHGLEFRKAKWMLEMEGAFRSIMARVGGSWRQTVSGINAAAAFAAEDSEGGPTYWPTTKVLRFIATFSNGHTAGNYVGALTFALQFVTPQATWDPSLIASVVKGKKKATYVTSKVAFTSDETVKLARMAIAEGSKSEAYEYILAFAVCARTQSEIRPLRSGLPSQPKEQNWHSAITLRRSSIVIDWQQRKNTQGRPVSTCVQCQCGGVALRDRVAPCAPCAVKDIFKDLGLDEHGPTSVRRLLDTNGTSARRNLIRRARCIRPGLSDDSIIGFHGFRRGRAQHERRLGTPISRILEIGGWKSSAVLRYLAMQEIDDAVIMRTSVEESESE